MADPVVAFIGAEGNKQVELAPAGHAWHRVGVERVPARPTTGLGTGRHGQIRQIGHAVVAAVPALVLGNVNPIPEPLR